MPSCRLVLYENIASSSQSSHSEFFATNCLRYFLKTWFERSNDPFDWEWEAVVRNFYSNVSSWLSSNFSPKFSSRLFSKILFQIFFVNSSIIPFVCGFNVVDFMFWGRKIIFTFFIFNISNIFCVFGIFLFFASFLSLF